MATVKHPLEPAENAHSSHESLPTPPRSPSPSGQAAAALTANTPPPQLVAASSSYKQESSTPSALEAGVSPGGRNEPSPCPTPGTLGAADYLGYFPPVTPVTSYDPLLLKSRLQTEDHITDLRKRKGKGKSAAFYTKQNQHITGLLKHLDDHVREADEEEDTNRLPVRSPLTLALR